MWGVGGLQLYGICSCRLVYSEVVETRSNYIITGVSFRKILGFYYKRNRQLFYYERTLSYIPLKIPERVNRVILQNSSELLLLKIAQQTKACSKSTTKKALALLQEFYSGVFIISLENIFEVYDVSGFRKSSGLYINSGERVCDGVCF